MLAACCRGMTWQSYCFDNGADTAPRPGCRAGAIFRAAGEMSRRCRKIDLRAPRGRWPGAGKAGVTMSVIAGYTVLFISLGRPAQITIADADESAIERLTVAIFGDVQVLARTPLDADALRLLKLKPGAWLEWIPAARND
jgi:hypothetical protein